MSTSDANIMLQGIVFIMVFMIVITVGGAALISASKRKRDRENNAQPIMRQKAKVVEKLRGDPDGILLQNEMWILFDTADGKRLRLSAKADNRLAAGDEGFLTWQGNCVRDFERIVK